MDIEKQKQIGERIRKFREAQGMTQEELAEKSGVSLPRISLLELGKTGMYLDTFIRITEALQVSSDALLRPDTDQGRIENVVEYSKILESCTPNEASAVIKITQDLLSAMRSNHDE